MPTKRVYQLTRWDNDVESSITMYESSGAAKRARDLWVASGGAKCARTGTVMAIHARFWFVTQTIEHGRYRYERQFVIIRNSKADMEEVRAEFLKSEYKADDRKFTCELLEIDPRTYSALSKYIGVD